MALPCPGDSACTAPQPKAASSSTNRTPSPAAARSKSAAKPSLPVRLADTCSAPSPRGADQRPVAGGDREGRLAAVERAVQQILGVAAQAVRRVAARRLCAHRGVVARARRRSPSSRCGPRRCRPRARPAAASRRPPAAGPRGASCRARRPRAGTLRRGSPACRSDVSRPSTVSVSPRSTSATLALEQLGPRHAPLLDRRDLGLVEDVANVDAVGGDRHLRQVVDGEVAERVRLGARGGERQGRHGHQREQEHSCLHRVPSSRSAAAFGDRAARPRRAMSK